MFPRLLPGVGRLPPTWPLPKKLRQAIYVAVKFALSLCCFSATKITYATAFLKSDKQKVIVSKRKENAVHAWWYACHLFTAVCRWLIGFEARECNKAYCLKFE
jgi:hypothetical protein